MVIKGKSVTIREVAKRAEASIATVSHVLHKTRFVSEELTEKVNQAIKDLGYYPNLLVRSMRGKRTFTIGLVMPSISNETFSALAETIQRILFVDRYHVIICNTSYDEEIEVDAFNTLLTKKVDGLIVIPATRNGDKIREILELGIPVVLVDRIIPDLKVDSVVVDNFKGMYEATTHLIGLGHRRIGYIDRVYDHSHNIEQKKGFLKALADHGIPFDEELTVRADGFEYESGARAVKVLLAREKKPTAVMAYYDIPALGAMRGIIDMGFKIPEDISVTGCDGMPFTSTTVPRLTTIQFPVEKLAETACKIILDRIEDPGRSRIKRRVIPPLLLIRESTAAEKR